MSKYTTEVRYICETYAGLTESAGYNKIDEVVNQARQQIFGDYEIFDTEYKSVLECKILRHYYTREICAETVGLWKLWLNNRMNEIMPYYNEMYKSAKMEYDPFKDVDITTERDVTDSGDSTRENKTERSNDVSATNTNERTNEISSDTTNNSTSSGEMKSTQSKTSSESDLYSDTPQGNVIGFDENKLYLTNARKLSGTETDTSTDTNEATANGTTNYEEASTISDKGNSTSNEVGETTMNETGVFTNTQKYIEHISGKRNGTSYAKILMEYRESLINIDRMIIDELADLFFGLWD